jgi:glycosyltransferase involved in cell wall biosynthesis
MKIAYLITKSNWGGAQKYVYELATSLPRDQYDARVIAGGDGPLIERLETASIKVIPVDDLGRDVDATKDLSAFREVWSIIRRERPDILHINSSKAGIMGALIGRLLRVPKIIFTAHGWAFNEDRPLYQKIVIKILHWATIVMCHRTIAVSENIKNAFKGWPGVAGKITVIYNGIKPGTSYAKNGARVALAALFPRLKEAIEHKHLYWIGTIAELHPIKNLDGALVAIKELVDRYARESIDTKTAPHILYTIMGEGRERARLERMIADLGLSEHVFLLGHVADAVQYIKAFDAFLLSSKSEALAYVLLEAGLQETPVVSTAVGGIPEIIEDMKSGILIQPRKPAEIAHALDFYAEHPDIARQYAKALHESVKTKFTLERMVRETENLYGYKE